MYLFKLSSDLMQKTRRGIHHICIYNKHSS